MNQDELLRAAAQAHHDWAVKYSDRVPVDRAMSNPHDGVRSDLEEHHLDVCAPPEIDDELNQRLVELLAQADGAVKADEGPAGDFKARHLIGWFNKGADGKIPWGSPGDFDACVRIAGEHMPLEKAQGFCANRHHDVTGEWPGPQAHKSDEGTDD